MLRTLGNFLHGLFAFGTVFAKQILLSALPDCIALRRLDNDLDGIIMIAFPNHLCFGPALEDGLFRRLVLLLSSISVGRIRNHELGGGGTVGGGGGHDEVLVCCLFEVDVVGGGK